MYNLRYAPYAAKANEAMHFKALYDGAVFKAVLASYTPQAVIPQDWSEWPKPWWTRLLDRLTLRWTR